ncbi:MAG: NB-ARC domain-containing protein [Mycobacterium sp.]
MSGRNCAYGLLFQYVVTLDYLLKMVERPGPENIALRVDPSTDGDNDRDGDLDIVDLDVEDSKGNRSVVVQVKGSREPLTAREVTGPDLAGWLLRLVRAGRSGSYRVITNRRLNQPAENIAVALDSGDVFAVVEALAAALPDDTWRDSDTRSELMKCRVDRQDNTELHGSLRSRITQLRRRLGIGIGDESAGMMAIYLVGQIFHCGAGAHPSRVSAAQARDWLHIPSTDVAKAIGHYDWGVPVNIPVPHLGLRTAKLGELSRLLAHPRHEIRQSRLVVVHGMSGIGKSALAAQFAYDNADYYDFMWWVDCESVHSVERSLQALGLAAGALKWGSGGPSLREIPRVLSQYPGTWLIVADNVYDRGLVEEWLPAYGAGDVLVTTVDSTLWSNESEVELTGFEPNESRRFLQSLLPDEASNDLDDLAAGLDHLPLALAMAAAYLRNAQRGLAGTPKSYLSQLQTITPQAQEAVPRGYPRTLGTAISLAVEQVSRRAAGHSQVGDMAIAMLQAAAYFAENDIPLNMLHAAAQLDPRSHHESGLRGPIAPLDSDTLFDAVVTILRSGSLVQRTELIAETTGMFSDMIAMNKVTQDIIRLKLEASLPITGVAEFLDRMIYHVDDWLRSMVDSERFKEMPLIHHHAGRLEGHATRIGLVSANVATLQGNLAIVYSAHGRIADAIELNKRELETIAELTRMGVDGRIGRVKTLIQLIDNLITSQRTVDEVTDRIAETVEVLESFKPDDRPELLGRQWMNVESALSGLRRHDKDPRVLALRRRVDSALRQLTTLAGPQSETELQRELNELEDLIGRSRREQEVSERAYRAFELCGYHGLRIGFLGLHIEAQGYIGNVEAVIKGLREFDSVARPLNVYASDAIDRLQNVGLAVAQQLGRRKFRYVLWKVVRQSNDRIAQIPCGAELRWFHHVLSAAYHAAAGNADAARAEIAAADSFGPAALNNMKNTQAWERILSQARWR